jgi:hypothetical protein
MSSYTVTESKTYSQPAEAIVRSAVEAISKLGGSQSKKSKPDAGRLDANFNKKIGSQPLNNRIQLEVNVTAQSPEQCTVSIVAYPIDPVGQKLMFGVRGQPARAVVDAFLGALPG